MRVTTLGELWDQGWFARVAVTCSEDAHAGRVVQVCGFQGWGLAAGPGEWHWMAPAKPGGGEYPVPDEMLRRHTGVAMVDSPSILCKLCGLKLSVRMATLAPVLDQLAQAGIASIELKHLTCIVAT